MKALSTVQEPMRERVGRVLYEEPGRGLDWYSLSEDKREIWRLDADRVIIITRAPAKEMEYIINEMRREADNLLPINGAHPAPKIREWADKICRILIDMKPA